MNLLTRLRLGEGLSAGERALAEVLLADLARRFAYYDRIVGMGGCGGAST